LRFSLRGAFTPASLTLSCAINPSSSFSFSSSTTTTHPPRWIGDFLPSFLLLPPSIFHHQSSSTPRLTCSFRLRVASSTSIHQLFLSAFINRTHIIASCSLSTSKPPITGDITFNLTVTDTQIARVLTMKIGPPKHRDLDDRTGSLGQTPVDLSKNVSDMDVTGGNSFTMSEIKSLDAAPTPGVPLAISDTKISGEVPTAPERSTTLSCVAPSKVNRPIRLNVNHFVNQTFKALQMTMHLSRGSQSRKQFARTDIHSIADDMLVFFRTRLKSRSMAQESSSSSRKICYAASRLISRLR
jgi:hypothetical protein